VGGAAINGAPGLLGRERELRELTTALSDAHAGRARLCLLTGEAGIGKTCLADALTRRAATEGADVRWGRAWEGGGAPAFWPWVQVLRGIVRDESSHELRDELAGGAGWVAQILPELARALPDVSPPGSIDTEQARFALFDAIATFLRNVSERRPLAIVLDDLHAADPPSVLALRFTGRALRDARVLFLATYQEAALQTATEVAQTIGELAREADHIALGPLSPDEVAGLFARCGVDSPDAELVRRVHATSEGNPFFASELVRLLAAEPNVGSTAATVPLPDTIREAVLRRVEPLGADAADTLSIAAAIGREFRLGTLERVAGVPRGDLLAVLDRAIDADMVAAVPDAPGRYRFAHGLTRHTLYEELPAPRRIRVHGEIGDVLEELYGVDAEPHVAELAHHFIQAAQGGYAAKAVDYATRAGERAMRLLAYEEAERLFSGALSALDLEPPDPGRRAELLLAVGQAQVRSGSRIARQTLLRAASAARSLGRSDLLARTALAFRAFARSPGLVDDEVVTLLEQALDQIEPGDSVLRARLLARLALQLYYAPNLEDRRAALVEEAIAIARRVASDEALANVLCDAQLATWSPDTIDNALELSREVLDIAERIGDRALALTSHNRAVEVLLQRGELAAADVEIETLDRLAHEAPEPRARAHVALQRSRRASIEGRFDDATDLTAEAELLGERAGDPAIRFIALGQHFEHAWMRGELPDFAEVAKRVADVAPGLPVWRAVLALVYAAQGRTPEARRELDALAADDFAHIPRHDNWLAALGVLADVCVALGDERRAGVLYGLLEHFEGHIALALHGLFAGPVARYLGVLAALRGERQRALDHLARARSTAARMGARPTLARIDLDEARILADGSPEERERAAQLAAHAVELADAMGARGVAAEAAELRDSLGPPAPAPPAPATPEPRQPLTASLRREGDVWLFDYEGRSIRVRDSKGMRYLARLLAEPGAEVHAVDLVGGVAAPAATAATAAAEAGLEARAGDDHAGPLLDDQAKAAYRQRVEALREDIEEAESFNDPERAARAREEMELIAEQLAGAVGLGGRDRKAASTSERARVNATRSIRTLLKRVAEYDEGLGHELESTVRTGTFCAYEPDPRRPVRWSVEL
jgi:ATP/maltotriose-dependent transcriptional regulator MalT